MFAYPGRPREFTHKKREELIDHIGQGASVEEAARIMGVSLRTVQREAKHNEHFDHDLQLALHATPPDPHKLMQRAARTHWRAAAWLLERTDPDRFAKRPPNSCSPETLMDACDWLIEKALEATPPDNREAMYRHMRAAADKALDVLMPDQHIARRGMTKSLAEQPAPLSSQEFVKTIRVISDRNDSEPALLESEPPLPGSRMKLCPPPPVPSWIPPSGYKRQDSEDMDAAWRFPTPEEEEAYGDAADRYAELIAARDAARAERAAAARKKSRNGKSPHEVFQREKSTKTGPPWWVPIVTPRAVESPPTEEPTVELAERAAAGPAPSDPPDGGIMSPKMRFAT